MIASAGSCYACSEAAATDLPPRARILRTARWRVVHTFEQGLPGWLVVIPCRHVLRVSELTEDEATELGLLLRDLSAVLEAELGCRKTYVMQFAEAEGFAHVHFHVVPRMPDLAPELRGPRIFGVLGGRAEHPDGLGAQDRLATALADRLADVRRTRRH